MQAKIKKYYEICQTKNFQIREMAFKKEAPTEPKTRHFFHYKHVTPLELEVDGVSLTP
jgi:hypothetical protein